MSDWEYPGARWWKFDFHTHTPASYDFRHNQLRKKAQTTPEDWLRKFMEKGIECVAITDHNNGEWIDKLKECLRHLESNPPEWYRPLFLFPGVEITVNGGVHVLAIFDVEKNGRDIDSLLGAVDYEDVERSGQGVTKKSFIDVVGCIVDRGGIAIPAHADQEKGLFTAICGDTLKQALKIENRDKIHAIEICSDEYSKPPLYQESHVNWIEVRGSDVHNFHSSRFGSFTWIKMDKPSIEGLRLALIDGPSSVIRNMQEEPNNHAELIIEELTVKKTKYIGWQQPLICQFTPFLNTIIGGRGSGKSTLLEFMRLALRRKEEIPRSLQTDSEKYFNIDGENLLTEESIISLIYRKGNIHYRLNWSADADSYSLEERQHERWVSIDGEILSLFPAHIYSQKQIFELAKNPQALIEIIDRAREVEYEKIQSEKRNLEYEYKRNMRMIQEYNEKISQEQKHKGELRDVERQIRQIESSEHKEVLGNYRKRKKQLNEIKSLEEGWHSMAEWLENYENEISLLDIDEESFSEHPDILSALRKTNQKWHAFSEELRSLSQKAKKVIREWKKEKSDAAWMKTLSKEISQYQNLHSQFEKIGIDPNAYPALLSRQKLMINELHNIEEYKEQKNNLSRECHEIIKDILEKRKTLTDNRVKFLENILQNNDSINMEVLHLMEDWNGVEKSIRKILQCSDRFDRDFQYLKEQYHNIHDGIQRVNAIKLSIQKIRKEEDEARDQRFMHHLRGLPQESIDDLMLWFPNDDLKITFGSEKQKLQSGSPGQQTAVLLAFIMSHGKEPLLLDQPEDDLDNELIYKLIVQQLRKIKHKRQVIIITHNANIVVNGDAEMVFPLEAGKGQSCVKHAASIQNIDTRKKICDILEGGKEAFDQRYKRINLE